MVTKRNRTSAKDVGYALYLYFLGLFYRNTAKALSRFIKRSYVYIWKWMQRNTDQKKYFLNQEIPLDYSC